ncbi:hypothetical protein N7456_007339 [Penicillium angulare]|uniref:Quinate repressor protein n=1 Tax=Penicillium angulare TaxID=116970 RepID=A0A9W9FAF9_9EURO|nr:hypothetical protein N7456_007339 [Penicillium angulare]
MLHENESDCIIECGMTSLNTEVQKFLAEYKRTHPVVYIIRHFDEIKSLLHLGDADARRLRIGDSKHRIYSDFEYFNLSDSGSLSENTAPGSFPSPHLLKEAKADFCNFLDILTCAQLHSPLKSMSFFDIASTPVENRLYSYALALTLSELTNDNFDTACFESGQDAIRLIIDLKEEHSLEVITRIIASIRRIAKNPIIYDVVGLEKALSSAAYFMETDYLPLLSHGIRNCVDYMMVDLDLPDTISKEVISQKRRTKVIGCFHDEMPGKHGWQNKTRYEKYQQARTLGCDMVQLTQNAMTRNDNDDLNAFVYSLHLAQETPLPLIAYNTGPLGRSSLISNKILTPVQYHASNSTIDSFNMTARQAMRGLFATFIFDSLKFYHFGASVSWSPFPPAMHKAAYNELGLEHSYQVFETTTLQNIKEITSSPHFGGASISLPFKASILPSIDIKSSHATAIGAINTLLPLRDSLESDKFSLEYQASQRNRAGPVIGWYGDNTDWLGIFECVHKNLSPRNTIRSSKTSALVIGAGGAARAAIYALIQMGCRKILIFNRTLQHAEEVAFHFNSWANIAEIPAVIHVIQSISDPWPVDIQPATIIISCIPAHSIDSQRPANFKAPEKWIQSKSGGVVADVSKS